MAGWYDFRKLNRLVVPDCPLYEQNALSHLLVALDFYPLALTLGMFVWSMVRRHELLLTLLSFSLTADWLVAFGLQHLFGTPGPYGPACGGDQEMPSFSTQHITTFGLLWFAAMHRHADTTHVAALAGFQFAAVGARVYIGTNAPVQLLAGTAVGVLNAVVFYLIFWVLVRPFVATILQWRLCRWMRMRDTLIEPRRTPRR